MFINIIKRYACQDFFYLVLFFLSLSDMVSEINALVDELNRVAKLLNLKVDTYNKIGASRGETFTGGLYKSDERGRSIDIYEFSSHDKLVRILAHEFGHALGLDHIDDSEAIMYTLNQGGKGALSKSDLAILRELCNLEPST